MAYNRLIYHNPPKGASSNRVHDVFEEIPSVRSYVETANDFYVTKPTSTFVLKPPDQYVRWNTTWGASPNIFLLKDTMGNLKHMYNFDKRTTWSPNCANFLCSVNTKKRSIDTFKPQVESCNLID